MHHVDLCCVWDAYVTVIKKFTCRSTEYKNYSLARDYKPSIVDKHFDSVSSMRRANARTPQHKQVFNHKIKFISKYNLMPATFYTSFCW